MMQTMFNRGMIATLEPAVYFTAARHQAIVNNIANISTPGYQMMDAPVEEFRDAFQRALEARDERRVPVFDFQGSAHIVPRRGGGLAVEPQEFPRQAGLLKHDENNLFLELEMGKLSTNAGLHNRLMELLNHQFNLLESAIRERVT